MLADSWVGVIRVCIISLPATSCQQSLKPRSGQVGRQGGQAWHMSAQPLRSCELQKHMSQYLLPHLGDQIPNAARCQPSHQKQP